MAIRKRSSCATQVSSVQSLKARQTAAAKVWIRNDRSAVDAGAGEQGVVDMPHVQMLLPQHGVLVATGATVVLLADVATIGKVGARRVLGHVEIAGGGEAQALLDDLLLVDGRQVGKEILRLLDALMHIAVDQSEVGPGFAGPTRRLHGPCSQHRHHNATPPGSETRVTDGSGTSVISSTIIADKGRRQSPLCGLSSQTV